MIESKVLNQCDVGWTGVIEKRFLGSMVFNAFL